MKIGIFGGGSVGSALSGLMTRAGHEVQVGVRNPETADAAPDLNLTTFEKAAEHGEVVILAIPFTACENLLPGLAVALDGKVVVDATNPLHADWSPLTPAGGLSAGECIARWLPGAWVVKSFNTVFADIMNPAGLDREGQAVTAFIAGDSDDANGIVGRLARDAGFAPLIVGPLRMAGYLEGMAHLNIQLAVGLGRGTDGAFVYR